MRSLKRMNVFFAFLLSFALAVSCSSDDNGNTPTDDVGTTDDDPMTDDDPVEEGSLFVVNSLISTPNGTVSIVQTTTALQDGEFNTEAALEIDDFNLISGPDDGGYFLASAGDFILRRYVVDESGAFEQTGTLDFSDLGIRYNGINDFVFVNENLVYLIPNIVPVAIAFDPSDMTVIETIDLSEFEEDGYFYLAGDNFLINNNIYVVLDYTSTTDDFNDRFPGTNILKIDTGTNTATRFTDPREYTDQQPAGVGPDGLFYLPSYVDYPFLSVERDGLEYGDYLFRFDPQTDSYDTDFQISLAESTGVLRPMKFTAMLSNGDILVQVQREGAEYVDLDAFNSGLWDWAIVTFPDFTEIEFVDNVSGSPPCTREIIWDDQYVVQNYVDTSYSDLEFFIWSANAEPFQFTGLPDEQSPSAIVRIRK